MEKKEKKIIINSLNLIKYPYLTEKTLNLYKNQQYTFIVDRTLSKPEIKILLENLFQIKIIKLKTAILPEKKKRVGKYLGKRSQYKKVLIKLNKDQIIKELLY
jgi:large subunit ribosomal protein L23